MPLSFSNTYADMNCEGPRDSWSCWGLNSELEGSDCSEMGKAELGGYGESVVADDVIDKLPSDPFGMDIRSTITITGWFNNWGEESDSGCDGFGIDEAENESADPHELFAGLNWVWNGSMKFAPDSGNMKLGGISIPCDGFDGLGVETEFLDDAFALDGNVEDFMSFSGFGNWVVSKGARGLRDCGKTCFDDGEGDAPHDAMFFALGYLGVQDLLNVERVCKSLRDTVRSDHLLWRTIHIDQPLSEKITDDALLKLANRAQGTLRCLNLMECIRITDSGLKHVLETNPRLTKLSVPGCVRLSVDGLLDNLRAFKSVGLPGIKHLRIGGIHSIMDKQYEELQFLLNADKHMQMSARRPRIYRGGKSYLSCDDDCAIDVEVCPRCQKFRLVYDCPAESCQGKHQTAQLCRACILCIARCINCGRCIKDRDYEETFCLDSLCLDCWKQHPNGQDRPGENGAPSFIERPGTSFASVADREDIVHRHWM
ncbi:hypothetical protein I3843_03G046600 [Carya illinoinensis]|uniref:F-box domain-containing protein n=1 Tax=Carya illinoinensis TaxID=32201 RepID=A0A8T1QZH2_CARIL|nr:F-box protein SKIP14-like isoform X2 [Carya illinoinensis]KAG6659659.1 hypothetical protein CIPAW_03G050700 [Carya illinoinensis]KAG6720169.1 hypothetical protein I3842_03G045600 [Carya illinoinensis]KAG7985820.1 hypothetical protein I3843_03G046600 [Carya illinoinensis]